MKSLLPDQYQFSHQYALFLLRCLESLIIVGEKNKSFNIEFTPKEEDKQEFARLELSGKDLIEWLEKHEYTDTLGELVLKSLYPALLTDLCQFMSEALSCSERGRLTITYALLRKPLRDNLFYLEWLLADTEGFLNIFYSQEPAEFVLDRMLKEDKVRPIVRQAVAHTVKSNLLDPDVLFEIRYDKYKEYSFDSMWHKALHLITTAKSHSTEARNLNFVFSNDEDRSFQWNQLYTFLPIVLHYAVDVAESLMFIILGNEREKFHVDFFLREIGFALWSRDMVGWQKESRLSSEMPNDLKDMQVRCPRCNTKIEMRDDLAKLLFLSGNVICPNCFRKISVESIIMKNEL